MSPPQLLGREMILLSRSVVTSPDTIHFVSFSPTYLFVLDGRAMQVLDLSNNQLSTLPDSICKLSSLIELNVSSNDLEELPRDIGKLSKLKRVDASSNRLKFFPCALLDCTQMEVLNLEHNSIGCVPSEIALKLTNLHKLLLDGNPMGKKSASKK